MRREKQNPSFFQFAKSSIIFSAMEGRVRRCRQKLSPTHTLTLPPSNLSLQQHVHLLTSPGFAFLWISLTTCSEIGISMLLALGTVFSLFSDSGIFLFQAQRHPRDLLNPPTGFDSRYLSLYRHYRVELVFLR
jgi:hypothetical protein